MSDSKTEVGVEDVSIADAGVDEAVIDEPTETDEEPVSLPEPGVEDTDPQEPELSEETEEPVEEPEEPQEIELDFGGKKLTITKGQPVDGVAGELQNFAKNLEGDYTQKTQSLAEERKSLEAQTKAIQELSNLNEEALGLHGLSKSLKNEIDTFDKRVVTETGFTMDQLWAEDGDKARQFSDYKSRMDRQLQQVEHDLNDKKQSIVNEQSNQKTRFMEEGRKQVLNKIKGFDETEFVDFVTKTHGIPKEQAKDWALNPVGTIMAHESMLYRKMQDKLKTAKTPTVKPATPVPPSKTRSRNRSKTYGEMSMEEYAKVRNAEDAAG